MEELGFAPQAVADGSQYRLCLHQCPFREVAQRHQDVVCSLHLGLMQGALAQMRAPVTADRLEPFAEPSLCIAHLTARDEPAPASPSADQPASWKEGGPQAPDVAAPSLLAVRTGRTCGYCAVMLD